MPDDPDALLEAAEPAQEPVREAPPMPRPSGKRPYHEPIAPELIDDLLLAIGKGQALLHAEPGERTPDAIARYLDDVSAGRRRLPSDAGEAALALACALGQALAVELGWGWAHVRRTRSPGILVVSPDRKYAAAPRAVVDRALAGDGGQAVRDFADKLRRKDLPESEPGRYLRLS